VDADSNPTTECEPCVQNVTYAKNRGQTACTDVTVCGPGLLEDVAPTAERDRTCRPDPNAQGSSSKGSAGGSTVDIAAGGGGFLLLVIVVLALLLRRKKKTSPAYNSELGAIVDAGIWEIDRRLVRLADKLGVSARVSARLRQREPCT
jgi:hypothetical protein